MMGKLKLPVINISCGELYENTPNYSPSGRFVVVFQHVMFSEKALKTCLIQRLFFLSVYSIYVLKLGMYRKLYMKLKVERLLAHTKSRYQDIKYCLLAYLQQWLKTSPISPFFCSHISR